MKRTYHARSAEELKKIAQSIVRDPRSAFIRLFLFRGVLGAGKTTFIQGMAETLRARTPATSPTYSLIHEYTIPNQKKLYHIDLYRITQASELAPLEIYDLLHDAQALVCVEWPDAFMNYFSGVPRVEILITQKKFTRTVTVEWL